MSSARNRTEGVHIVSDLLGIVEVVAIGFLCFLPTYILQTWLCELINLPWGRPGSNLIQLLVITAILSLSGVVLSHTVEGRWWCLKKIANVVSVPPILATLNLYNSISTQGGHHNGRGTLIAQSLYVIECWFLITQLMSAVGYMFQQYGVVWNQTQHVLAAFRDVAFTSDWLRVLGHSVFFNLIDELHHIHRNPNPDSTREGEDESGPFISEVSMGPRSSARGG